MAETIINSNQLRQSGDTSTQTLIGANQVRQSGDSSSQTLLNKNQIAGGGAKTLNLVSVGGATYDSDYIFTKTVNDKTTYFETKEAVDILNSSNMVEFKIKFYYEANSNGIYKRATDTNFSGYISSNGSLWFVINSNHSNDYVLGTTGKWVWLKVQTANVGGVAFRCSVSFDGINYTYVASPFVPDYPSDKIIFGVGSSTGTTYGFKGKIDFKETDIIINGQSVLWV